MLCIAKYQYFSYKEICFVLQISALQATKPVLCNTVHLFLCSLQRKSFVIQSNAL